MNKRDPKLTVLLFNESINNQDAEGLGKLMSADHTFIDSSNEVHYADKETSIKNWQKFFDLYPDYRNHFPSIESREGLVLVIGHSTCNYNPLDGPAIWTARVENDLVAEWRVFLDTPENREKLGLT